jgi:ABC-type transport system substrate-binding protein
MVGISAKNPVLAKKRGLRLAFGLAVERDDLIDAVYGGRAVEAHGPLPPGLWGYRLEYKHRFQRSDADRARDILGSNGHPFGRGLPAFKLGCLNHPFEESICRILKKSWERVGLRVDGLSLTAEERRKAIEDGQVDLWPITWVADLPGTASFLEIFIGAAGAIEIPGMTEGRSQLEGLLSKIRNPESRASKQAAVDAAQDLVSQDGSAAFLVHRFQFWLVRKGFTGIGLEDFSWHDSDQVSIRGVE